MQLPNWFAEAPVLVGASASKAFASNAGITFRSHRGRTLGYAIDIRPYENQASELGFGQVRALLHVARCRFVAPASGGAFWFAQATSFR